MFGMARTAKDLQQALILRGSGVALPGMVGGGAAVLGQDADRPSATALPQSHEPSEQSDAPGLLLVCSSGISPVPPCPFPAKRRGCPQAPDHALADAIAARFVAKEWVAQA